MAFLEIFIRNSGDAVLLTGRESGHGSIAIMVYAADGIPPGPAGC
jgi:hypothetical protein